MVERDKQQLGHLCPTRKVALPFFLALACPVFSPPDCRLVAAFYEHSCILSVLLGRLLVRPLLSTQSRGLAVRRMFTSGHRRVSFASIFPKALLRLSSPGFAPADSSLLRAVLVPG